AHVPPVLAVGPLLAAGPVLAVGSVFAGSLLAAGPPPVLDQAAAAAAPATSTLCTIKDRRIAESSGLAAAGDFIYTVNDGGDRLQVFVLDRSCRVRRVIDNSLDPYDVEDLARGADGTLWLSDTGDNSISRPTVALERLTDSGAATLFRFSYPDGSRDAEALLLDRAG